MRTDISLGFILLAMLFGHVADDYGLQPIILSSLKQRSWWREHARQDLYRHDYVMALIMHAASWSFLVQLPVAWLYGFRPTPAFFVLYAANVAIHAWVDHAKANKAKINLIEDQLCHLGQIATTWIVLAVLGV